jgi:malate dehydrogenase (oxaloacetate-decarboxylating)
VTILKVSDRTFLVHLGGKIEIQPKLPIRNRDDLSMIYTPGWRGSAWRSPRTRRTRAGSRSSATRLPSSPTARRARSRQPRCARRALPVMEGKAALFKRFAGIDAFPICLDTQDVDEIVRAGRAHRPGVRGHQPRGHLAPRAASRSNAGCAPASTSRSSTTTSTVRRSSSLAR